MLCPRYYYFHGSTKCKNAQTVHRLRLKVLNSRGQPSLWDSDFVSMGFSKHLELLAGISQYVMKCLLCLSSTSRGPKLDCVSSRKSRGTSMQHLLAGEAVQTSYLTLCTFLLLFTRLDVMGQTKLVIPGTTLTSGAIGVDVTRSV